MLDSAQVDKLVHYERDGNVVTLTLNRPEKLNAWTGVMEQEVRAALIEATDDDGVGVVILTGAGRGFCSGADMDMLQGIGARDGKEESAPKLRDERHDYALTIPKPVVAAINGACAGLGFVHAMTVSYTHLTLPTIYSV